MTVLSDLTAARASAASQLAALTAAGLKANSIGPGSNVDHQGRIDALLKTIEALDKQIQAEEARVDGPWEVSQYGDP